MTTWFRTRPSLLAACTIGVLALGVVPTSAAQRGSAAATSLTADALFDQSAVRDIHLTMKPDDWDTLRARSMANDYYRADMTWGGLTVPIVGVRSRGTGSRNSSKPSLRVDFDRYVDQKFLGLKSVVLANAVQDPSMMKQRLAMLAFARMGVPAPRVAHVRLHVNGTCIGLYMLIESVDKAFLKRVFTENDGYLYEYNWQDDYGWEYLGSDLAAYARLFEAKTHENEAPALLYGPIEDFFRTFNQVADADFEPAVGTHLDIRQFIRYLAAESFMADRDGFLGMWGPNNFYLYRYERSTVARLIPWDKDLAFDAAEQDLFQGVDGNVLTRRLLAIPTLRREYLEALLACAALVMARETPDSPAGWFEAEVQKVASQILTPALEDPQKPYDNERVADEMAKVLAFARNRGPFVVEAAQRALAETRAFR